MSRCFSGLLKNLIYIISLLQNCDILYIFRREKKTFEKYQKAVRSAPSKKEREEIESLSQEVKASTYLEYTHTMT